MTTGNDIMKSHCWRWVRLRPNRPTRVTGPSRTHPICRLSKCLRKQWGVYEEPGATEEGKMGRDSTPCMNRFSIH
jgi:hypothetical protein